MPLHLKDVTQAVEVLRRTRRDMEAGSVRDRVDERIGNLADQIAAMVESDQRSQRIEQARESLIQSAPKGVMLDRLRLTGKLDALAARVAAGETPSDVWGSLSGH